MAATSLKRSELRHCYAEVRKGTGTLLEVLETGHEEARKNFNGGRVPTSVSGAGISRTLLVSSEYGPGQFVEAYEELLSLYDRAVANVVTVTGADATDALVYSEMIALLEPCVEIRNDYTGLRL